MAERELNIQHIFARMAKKVILDRKNHSAAVKMIKGIAIDTRNAANPACLCLTKKDFIYIDPFGRPSNWDIKLGSQLRHSLHITGRATEPSFEEILIRFDKSLTKGQLLHCMFSLRDRGEQGSLKLLEKCGISIEKINLDTNMKVAEYSSHHLMNTLFGMNKYIEDVREAIDAFKVRIFALQAAKLLGLDDKAAKILADIKTLKVSPPCKELMGCWTNIDKTAEILSIVPQIKIQGPAKGEFLTTEELSSDFSAHVKKIQDVTPERIMTIQHKFDELHEIIARINGGPLEQALKKALNTLQTMDENLADINVSTKKTMHLLEALVKLSRQYKNNAVPTEAKDEEFKEEKVDATFVIEPLPEIPREIAGNFKILYVDDEKAIRESMSGKFKEMGFPVKTAVNGEEALAKFRQEDFDLIITDFSMPKMDGVDFILEAKICNPDKPNIPACFFTATQHHLAPSKLHFLLKENEDVDFIQKDPSNIAKILKLAIQAAQKKAGIEITDVVHKTAAEKKKHETPGFISSENISIWCGRVVHKMNNKMTPLFLSLDALWQFETKSKKADLDAYATQIRQSIEHCFKIIEQLKLFAEKYKSPTLESIGVLPEDLQKDEETANVIAKICKENGPEHLKLYGIAAVIAVLYSPVLAMIAAHFGEYQNKRDRTELYKAWSRVNSLRSFNDALYKIPTNSEMKLASNTIDYLMK
jgi:CheY-like chemotaxis protein